MTEKNEYPVLESLLYVQAVAKWAGLSLRSDCIHILYMRGDTEKVTIIVEMSLD